LICDLPITATMSCLVLSCRCAVLCWSSGALRPSAQNGSWDHWKATSRSAARRR